MSDEASTMDFEELLDGEPLPEIKHSPTVREIREWANENGFSVPAKGRIKPEVREAFNKAHNMPVDTRPAPLKETAPKYEPQTVSGKVKGFFKSPSKGDVKVKRNKPRVSVADLITGGWWLLSKAAEPVSAPMAKALAIEAPIAGMMLDQTVKGTMIDRVLQPFARAEESSKVIAALITPPLLVGVIDKNPAMAQTLLPVLRKSLQWHIEAAGPLVAEKMAKEAEFEANYGTAVDELIMTIFNVEPENAESSAEG